MKRSKKLLILILILALAVAAFFGIRALTADEKKKESVTETKADAGQKIFSFTAEDITAFAWTYRGESFRVSRTNGGWTLDGEPDFKADSAALNRTASGFSALTASRLLDGALDDSVYGLNTPTCAVTVTLKNGESFEVKQGLTEPASGLHYLKYDGRLYAVATDIGTFFGKDRAGLYANDPIPNLSQITGLRFTAGGESYHVVYDPGCALDYGRTRTYFLETESGYIPLDSTKSKALFDTVSAFKWAKIYAYGVSEAELRDTYGLADPFIALTVEYTDENAADACFSVHIGSSRTGYYHSAALPGSDVVYDIVNAVPDALSAFAVNDYKDLALLGYESINNLVVSYDGKTFPLYFEGHDGTVQFYLGEKELTEDQFLSITPMITHLYANEIARPEDAGRTLISITVPARSETAPEITLTFCDYDADTYICLRSDGEAFRIDAATVDKLIRIIRLCL